MGRGGQEDQFLADSVGPAMSPTLYGEVWSDKVLEKAQLLSKDQLRRLPLLEEMSQQGFEAAKARRR